MMTAVIDFATGKAKRARRKSVETTTARLLRLSEELLAIRVERTEEERQRTREDLALLGSLVAALRELAGQKPAS